MIERRLLPLLVASMLIGCGKDEEADIIIEGADASIDGVLGDLPTCEPASPDGRLDLVGGCAMGACVGMTYDEVVAAVGEDGACEPATDAPDAVLCTWDAVLEIAFDDLDRDMNPDKGDLAAAVTVHSGFEGGTAEGLGIGASSSCFLDQLGEPDLATWQLIYDRYVLVEATWIGWGLTLVDDDGPPGEIDPDGIVDLVVLEGAR